MSEESLKNFEQWWIENASDGWNGDAFVIDKEAALKLWNTRHTEEKADWKLIAETFPQENTRCLIFKNGEILIETFTAKNWKAIYADPAITHWMPLPKGPK